MDKCCDWCGPGECFCADGPKKIEDDPDYDGAPYCSYGHRTKADCDCGPIAENE